MECVWMRQYDKAKEYIDKMLNEKIDDQSCEACELNFMLDYYLETGQFDEAYSRAQPLINKQVTCYEANLRAYLKLSYYAQKAGKPEIAADMGISHQAVYKMKTNALKQLRLLIGIK